MKTIISLLFLVISLNSVSAQYKWDKLSYTHSSGSDNSKTYYIINVDNNGQGKLESFKSGKSNTTDFQISRKNLNYLNSKITNSGIYKINPKNLFAETSPESGNIYTMTLTLDDEFGENYEYKFDRTKLPPKYEGEKSEPEKEEEKGEKPQVIPVPANINSEYKKAFYNLYYEIELIIPDKVWVEAGLK